VYNPELLEVKTGGVKVGHMTSMVYSPRFAANLGYALVGRDHVVAGTTLEVMFPAGPRAGVTEAIPFVDPIKSG
jgi:aminomethyltransferase